MIPVKLADPPSDFDTRVKKKGLRAIAELVGETPTEKRPGPKRTTFYKNRDEIPSEEFPPLWREVLPDMLTSYKRICAYLCLYIPPGTGSPSVDHVFPKSKRWDQVLMHPLHDYVAKRLADKLKHRKVVVWYDQRSEFVPFVKEMRGGPRTSPEPVDTSPPSSDKQIGLARKT